MAGLVTLKNSFEQEGDLEHVGSTEYLAELAFSVITIINAEDDGRTIDDLYMRRKLIALDRDLLRHAYEPRLEQEHGAMAISSRPKAVCSGLPSRETREAGFRHCPRYCSRLPKVPGCRLTMTAASPV